MVLCLGGPPMSFLCSWLLLLVYLFGYTHLHFIFAFSFHFWSSFCCCSSFVDVLHFVVVFHSYFLFDVMPPFRGLSPGFYTHFILLANSIAEWFANFPFSTIPLIFLPRALRLLVGIFYPQAFFTLCSITYILTCICQGFPGGACGSSLGFARLHTDPRNSGPVHLLVCFTVIHSLHTQNDSALRSTIY